MPAVALALVLAALTALASPVAGAFLALAGARRAAPRAGARRSRWRVAIAALAPVALLELAFPEGGYEPFAPRPSSRRSRRCS